LQSRARGKGIVVHRRKTFESTSHHRIPVTTPAQTVVDIAPSLARDDLEHAINEADKRRLVDPEQLRAAVDELPRTPGIAIVRATLEHRTFTLTDSRLERLFIPIALRAGLPMPLTQQWVNGFRVDFYWPELKLIVETDGLTYHRTPAQQAGDAIRSQTHSAKGFVPLRFTRAQVKYEPAYVESILREVATRLSAAAQPA
jgi:very-short-patch-repair endonuclease